MRELIKSITFVPGLRTITVNDTRDFTVSDILVITNRTTGDIIYDGFDDAYPITLNGKSITYSSLLPALAEGNKIKVEIDYPLPTGLNILNEYDSYRTKVASAVTTQKQNATPADTADQMHAKILAITGNVTVTPIQGNAQWHDLAYEIAQWNDIENTYVCAVLLQPGISQVFLTGAAKYKVSDGNVYTSSQTVTIGANESGRESKITKYIIFRASTPYISISFGSYPNISLAKNILMLYNKNCDYSTLSFTSAYVPYFVNDAELKNPIVFGADRKLLTLTSDSFKNNRMNRFIFPQFTSDATTAEKTLVIPSGCFNGCSGLTDLQFPEGILSLTIGADAFVGTGFHYLKFPTSLKSITFGNGVFWASALVYFELNEGIEDAIFNGIQFHTASNLSYLKIPVPKKTFSNFSQSGYTIAAPKIELGEGWNFTISLIGATALTTVNSKTFICDRLVDYRAVPANGTPTLQTSTANAKCYGTNTQFTKVHHVGETIYVNAVAKVIYSIESDTELTMTTNGSSTASGLSYGSGKTLTLVAAVKTALTADYPSWQTDLQAKGWTIA